jgi:hypothetical protein
LDQDIAGTARDEGETDLSGAIYSLILRKNKADIRKGMEQNLTKNRPGKVSTALTLLYVALGLGVLRNILEASRFSWTGPAGFVMLITLALFAIGLFLIRMTGRGENWARIALLVAFILVIPFVMIFLAFSAANPIYGLLGLGQILLPVMALVFLFQKPSSAWFRDLMARKRKAHRRRFAPQLTTSEDSPPSPQIQPPQQQPVAEEKVETNYYEVLELQPGASREAIQKAHRALVKVWSQQGFQNDPNIQEIANRRLEEIHSAYEKLMTLTREKGLDLGKREPTPPYFQEPRVGMISPESEEDHEWGPRARSDKKR